MKLGAYVLDFDRDFLMSKGFDSLVFPLNTPDYVLREAEKDFKVYLEFKPFEGGVVENVYGKTARLGPLGCPSDERLREENFRRVEEVGYEVILDFVRFPSPSNGDFFYSCFCECCVGKARELGFDLEVIRKSVIEFVKGGDVGKLGDWFEFKREVIRDYIESYGFKRAFVFTPSLSFLVGQSYDLGLRVYYPMLYPEDVGPACIGYELKRMDDRLKGLVLSELGGLDELVIRREFERIRVKAEPIVMAMGNLRRKLELLKDAERVYIFAYSKSSRQKFEDI